MFRRLLRHFSFANVCSFLALTIALGTGTAYAANTVFSTDIVDGEVMTADLANNGVTTGKIGNNQIRSADVRDDTLVDGGLAAADLAASSVAGSEVVDGALTGADIAASSITGADIATGSIAGSDVLDGSLGSADIANRTVNMDDIDGADRSGAIAVGAISNGRCVTITGSVSGAEAGDAAILTTNGTIPNGMLIYAQRALTDAVEIKVCNLTGATSAAIADIPVRVITFH